MADIIEWDEKFNVGIKLVDEEHKKLVELTNDLFKACQGENVDAAFRAAVKKAVDYVKVHFKDEEGLQIESGYPNYKTHKKKHEDFVRAILDYVKSYQTGQKYAPNNFVRYLKDWLLEHIAISDKEFAKYYLANAKK